MLAEESGENAEEPVAALAFGVEGSTVKVLVLVFGEVGNPSSSSSVAPPPEASASLFLRRAALAFLASVYRMVVNVGG
jgi:hypothetical protein